MKLITLLFMLVISNKCFAQFWEVAQKAASVELLTDSITELSDSIADESELSHHLDHVKKASSALRSTLRDLDYTESEITEILNGGDSSVEDLASSISRTARRINRAKNLVKHLSLMTAAAPEAVTASQTIEMNQTLRDIHVELQHQRMDREMDKDKARADELAERIAEKKKEVFFKKQFALMADASKTSSDSFFPFKDESESRGSLSKALPSWL